MTPKKEVTFGLHNYLNLSSDRFNNIPLSSEINKHFASHTEMIERRFEKL